jgi:hypothetical protein
MSTSCNVSGLQLGILTLTRSRLGSDHALCTVHVICSEVGAMKHVNLVWSLNAKRLGWR